MASSTATTVEEYLREMPEDRRAIISPLRDWINRHLPEGFEEAMNWGMISWQIPLQRYPHTYNNKPLLYASLAAQKQYNSLYLMCLYTHGSIYNEDWLKNQFAEHQLKLNIGKSCVRFKQLEDLPLAVIAEVIGSTSVDEYIRQYEASRA
jgi:hypothetical protein